MRTDHITDADIETNLRRAQTARRILDTEPALTLPQAARIAVALEVPVERISTVKRWGVTAVLTRTEDGWSTTRQVPYFLLDANVQGTLHRQAALNVALSIIADIAGVDRPTLTDGTSPLQASVEVAPIF